MIMSILAVCFIGFCIWIVIVVIIVSYILHNAKEDDKKRETNDVSRKIYLNMNSTYKSFNSTDVMYDNVVNNLNKEQEIKDFIKLYFGCKADDSNKVIFTSGATESLVTCLNWIKHHYQTVELLGSKHDHSSVKDNCNNIGIKYITDVVESTHRTKAIIVTHVDPLTGEIYEPDLSVLNNFDFVLFDVSQSVGKVGLNLSGLHNNYAVFFSLHKIGGSKNCGILMFNDRNNSFVPLIAGKQQAGLRGGTYDQQAFLQLDKQLKSFHSEYNYKQCKSVWTKFYNKLKNKSNVKVYTPTNRHLYTTLLLEFDDCVLGKIEELAKNKIYVNASTSCLSNTDDNHIRLSFINPVLTNKEIEFIVKVLTE